MGFVKHVFELEIIYWQVKVKVNGAMCTLT